MLSNEKKNISRFLSLVLRHKPETIDIKLDKNGWVTLKDILHKINIYKRKDFVSIITTSDLEEIVRDNDKQRFTFNEDRTKIRANQGHSVKIDLALKAIQPPYHLFHGTSFKYFELIQSQGLKKMNRQHVHLTDNEDTANNVGLRKGKDLVLLIVNAKVMAFDGFKFYKSENGVWLTENVPAKYIKIVNINNT